MEGIRRSQLALKDRWMGLWERLEARGDMNKEYANLVGRYAEPHRVYHTLEHIKRCLDEFEKVRHLAMNPNAVEFALWYHDAVYDTRRTDNELRSAALALVAVNNASLHRSFGMVVGELIMATKFASTPATLDARILSDIDLSVLAWPDGEFDEYERQIRKEYGWAPDESFRLGRTLILKSFLDRPVIYLSPFFRKFEQQAWRNIERSLARFAS